MHPFPSLEWMTAYAAAVAAHPRAATLATALAGRYRFVIKPSDGLEVRHAYDLVVMPGPSFAAEVATQEAADLTVTADYDRWRGLLTGTADFTMSFLMRKIKVEGDVGRVRSRTGEARPLLDCLSGVPTTFLH